MIDHLLTDRDGIWVYKTYEVSRKLWYWSLPAGCKS